MLLKRAHLKYYNMARLKRKQLKKRVKKVQVSTLTTDEIDFRAKLTRDKEGHCIFVKGFTSQEDIMILSICVSSNRTLKYIK